MLRQAEPAFKTNPAHATRLRGRETTAKHKVL
jgi:hypothetical protein